MRQFVLVGALAFLATGCATVSKITIEQRLEDLGLSSKRAACMSDELDARLNDEELSEFARFTVTVSRKDSPIAILDSLQTISEPKIARAVGESGLVCILRG